jgi:hypothetical protein
MGDRAPAGFCPPKVQEDGREARQKIKSAHDLRSAVLLVLTVSKVAVDIDRDHDPAANPNIPRAMATGDS